MSPDAGRLFTGRCYVQINAISTNMQTLLRPRRFSVSKEIGIFRERRAIPTIFADSYLHGETIQTVPRAMDEKGPGHAAAPVLPPNRQFDMRATRRHRRAGYSPRGFESSGGAVRFENERDFRGNAHEASLSK